MTIVRAGLAAVAACAATAQTPGVPGWRLTGAAPSAYEAVVDTEVFHGGRASARVRCLGRKCPEFATLMQGLRADNLIGQRVRLSAWVKADGKGARPRIWMRVDGHEGEVLAFDNRDGSAKRAPFDWQRQEIVLDVEAEAAVVYFGFILDGPGPAWVDDLALELVSKRVKTSNLIRGPVSTPSAVSIGRRYDSAHREPQNLDFEAATAAR